jgi:hypothetical protein
MRSAIVAVLCVAFALRTSGQTPMTFTFNCPSSPLVPTAHSEIPDTLPALVITSDYYAQPKVLVLHVFNNSGKDITGYIIVTRHKNPDGTVNKGGWGSSMSDMLNMLIVAQMAKDAAAPERIRQQADSYKVFAAAGNGIFLSGQTRDTTLTGINSATELDITEGAAFFTDGSYDQQDEGAFKQLLAVRQGELQQMKEVDDLIRNALADPTNDHPVAGVLAELNKRRVEAMDKPGNGFFPMDSNLQNLQRPAYGEQKGKTERERLTQYVEEQEKRVELMTPHCHLEIALKQ